MNMLGVNDALIILTSGDVRMFVILNTVSVSGMKRSRPMDEKVKESELERTVQYRISDPYVKEILEDNKRLREYISTLEARVKELEERNEYFRGNAEGFYDLWKDSEKKAKELEGEISKNNFMIEEGTLKLRDWVNRCRVAEARVRGLGEERDRREKLFMETVDAKYKALKRIEELTEGIEKCQCGLAISHGMECPLYGFVKEKKGE